MRFNRVLYIKTRIDYLPTVSLWKPPCHCLQSGYEMCRQLVSFYLRFQLTTWKIGQPVSQYTNNLEIQRKVNKSLKKKSNTPKV